MKINVSFPQTGCQKLFEIEDENKVKPFFDRRLGHEMEADSLGDEWKGYIVRIAGGNDKQGFPMKQGVLTNSRVRLLLSKGHSCYRPRRTGERKRKSVRGCIVDGNLSVLALVVLKKGEKEIPGLTDTSVPRRLGPKRASKIRKLFNLDKEDDVRRFVIRRPLSGKEGKKPKTVCPKIQRLITPLVLQHRRRRIALKKRRREKNRQAKAEFNKMLMMKHAIEKKKRREEIRRRTSSMMSDTASESSRSERKPKAEPKVAPAPKIEKKTDPKSIKKITPKAAPAKKETVAKAGAATAKAVAKTSKTTSTKQPSKPAVAKPAPKPAEKSATKKPASGKPAAKPSGGAAKGKSKPKK